MDLKSFKEEYVFTKYKNKCFKNAERLKGEIVKRYGKVDIDADTIYKRIVRYQVEKYGMTLCLHYERGDR